MAWKRSDQIATVSAACTIAVFLFGICQYRSSENWKRSEFVTAQIKDFNSDKINRAVLLMMDYDPAHVELYPEKEKNGERYVDISFGMLIEAVAKDQNFTDKQFRVKIFFEQFLKALSRFNYFLDSGAIEPDELCADFGYPIELMTGKAREMKLKNTGVDIAPFSNAVQDYLTRWSYTDIIKFENSINQACYDRK